MSVSPCLFVCKNCILYCKAARANNIMRNWNTSNYEKTLDIAFYCMKDDFARLVFFVTNVLWREQIFSCDFIQDNKCRLGCETILLVNHKV